MRSIGVADPATARVAPSTARPTARHGVVGVLVVLLAAAAGCTTGPVATLDLPAATVQPDPSATAGPVPPSAGDAPPLPPGVPSSSVTDEPATGAATDAASRLVVKGRAPMTGYEREEFGSRWSDDVGHVLPVSGSRNGCDQRNDVLRRDLTQVVLKPRTDNCVAASGTLLDPYTGDRIAFVRGPRSSEVQIDHVVALADAWQKGAQQWDPLRRRDFAGDPLNLLAVKGSVNQSKGAGDAATWLPPRRSFRCDYAARIVAVKAKYGVWVTAAEKAALLRILAGCPGQGLPSGAAVDIPAIQR